MTPYYADNWLTVYVGDCRAVLAELPAESVHCVVTSPPYWGLRDYGTASWDGGDADCDHASAKRSIGNSPSAKSTLTTNNGRGPQPGDKFSAGSQFGYAQECKCGATRVDNQLGLEPTPEQYVANMVAVFREIRRVLRRDGTLWLNLGDSYGSGARTTQEPQSVANGDRRDLPITRGKQGFAKQLVGIPWRVAFALQADGWYLRSDIIWSKPNPMPESVTDRPTKSHEYLFLFAKSERYYFDADAVREVQVSDHPSGNGFKRDARLSYLDSDGPRGNDEQWQPSSAGRNIRSVWQIATQPYPGAHFATFPPKLVEPCIKAGTSERGVCPKCGAPWRRVVEIERRDTRPNLKSKFGDLSTDLRSSGPGNVAFGLARRTEAIVSTTGWQPSCPHLNIGAHIYDLLPEPVPATVLDPFAGSGTTGMVAQSLSRRAVLIDLNPAYLMQAMERNADIPLGLAG